MQSGQLFAGGTIVVFCLHSLYLFICLGLYAKDWYNYKKRNLRKFMKPIFFEYYLNDSNIGKMGNLTLAWLILALFLFTSIFVAKRLV